VSKPSGNQTVTNKVDPAQEARNQQIWQEAQRVSGQDYQPYTGQEVAGVNNQMQQAGRDLGGLSTLYGQLGNMGQSQADRTQPYQQAGATGARALGGDQDAISSLMNPYQQNVIGALGQQYDKMRNQAALGSNDAATQAGAFGGDRHALMVGERQGALDQQQASDTANLLYGGYNDTMNRAGQTANMGLGAGGLFNQSLGLQGQFGQAQQGVYGQQYGMGQDARNIQQQQYDVNRRNFDQQQNWDVRNFDILKSGSSGLPYGTSSSQPTQSNMLGSTLGGAAAGGSIGGPIGAGIGGGLGFLGSLF
jgi:hypothetical protein